MPCYNPLDVVAALRRLVDAHVAAHANVVAAEPGTPAAAPAVVELPELHPWHSGFTGTYETVKGKLHSRGRIVRAGPTKLRVLELPIGTWTEDFKEALEALVERSPEVKSFSNASTDSAVDFTVTFASKDHLDAWTAPGTAANAWPFSRFEAELKLLSNKGMSTTNMHLFNASGQIRCYASATDIVREFFPVRMAGYTRRKELQLEALCQDALVLAEKTRFLQLVVDGKLELHRLTGGADGELGTVLAGHGLARMDGGYKYLLSMPMAAMTADRKAALERQLTARRTEIAALELKSPAQLWVTDLDAFEAEYRSWSDGGRLAVDTPNAADADADASGSE